MSLDKNIVVMSKQEHEQSHGLSGSDPAIAMQFARLEKSLTAAAQVFLSLGERIQTLETIIHNQITISGAEGKTVREAVRSRAREFCEVAHVSYREAGRMVRKAIWHDFLNEFSISSYHDLPKRSFHSCLEFIKDWRSYSMAKKLNQLYKGGTGNA